MTLEDLLRSRDARVARQRELLTEHPGMSLLCLTVQLPGPVKRNDISLKIAKAGVEAVHSTFTPFFEEQRDLETGFEAFFVVDLPPEDAKRLACRIEDTHPLGRLMDIDVIISAGSASASEEHATLGRLAAVNFTPQSLCDSPQRGHVPVCDGAPVREGTGAERSEASGGAERSEASELPGTLPAWIPTPLGREALGLPPRKCLLCDNDVRICMRARTHTTEELLAKIAVMVGLR